MTSPKGNIFGLAPLFIFIVVYFCTSLLLQDFYKMPILVAFLFAALAGLIIFPSTPFHQKLEMFTRGAGDSGIMLMVFIFLLAGAFAALGKSIGAVQSTVNFALSYISPQWLVAGLFLTACFISLSLGTSVGTTVALAPIAVQINEAVPGNLGLTLGAVVGGSMFGDNLSIISDTTIAATRSQGVEMIDKFKVNFWIALPPALITIVLYLFTGSIDYQPSISHTDYDVVKILPYLFVLVAALLRMHVIWVLVLGIFITFVIGLSTGSTNWWPAVDAINGGMAGMFELSLICIVIGGVVGLVRLYGGINYILYHVSRWARSARTGELGIATLTAFVNAAIANNTITILIVGPLAKTIADDNNIDPRRSASIMDTMSCFVQGCLPYGAQLLAALAAASFAISPLQILSHLYYPYLLGGSTILFILLRNIRSNK